MKRLIPLILFLILTSASHARAQEEPPMPPPLKALADEGTQIRYLGRHSGLDGWITVRNGQEQYFYVTGDGQALVMGVLFDRDGKLVTVQQVKELQEKSGDVLGMFAETGEGAEAGLPKDRFQMTEFKTPAEQLYDDVTNSNWISLGNPDAPVIYTFVDPQCPHCHAFTKDLRQDYIESGRLQMRIIPVGLSPETRAQAAFLLAAPNPQERWFRHLDGDDKALPVSASINEQGVERNLAIMQSWKLDVTPLTVYRGQDGQVKIVQGRSKNAEALVRDIAVEAPQPVLQ